MNNITLVLLAVLATSPAYAQSTLYSDPTTGHVGIGTTSPGALLDIGSSGTTLGTLRLEGNTSGYVQLQPAAAAGSWTMTLPSSAGTSGYVLQTDGSGVTSWVAQSGGGGRTLLTTTTNFYVATTGSDSNNCSISAKCLTIGHAINYIQSTYDLGGQTVNLNVANGTYTSNITLSAPFVGGSLNVIGNTTTPTNVVISTTAADCIDVSNGAVLSLEGFETKITTSGIELNATTGGKINIYGAWNFGTGASGNPQISANGPGSIVNITSNYTISGGGYAHYSPVYEGVIYAQNLTVTLSGTPAFSNAFAKVVTAGILAINGTTWSGSGTGTQYIITSNGIINSGACASIPGSGTSVSTQGQCL
jgi:hypothetical protein